MTVSLGFLSISFNWDRPTNFDGRFEKYIFEWSSDQTNWTVLTELTNPFNQTYTQRSNLLTPGQTFYYRLKTVSTGGTSAPSDVVSFTAVARSGTSIPTNVMATKQTASSIRVSWTAPTDVPQGETLITHTNGLQLVPTDVPQGETISEYTIFRTANDGDSWTNIGRNTVLTYTSSSLDANTCYGFRVRSKLGYYTESNFSDEAYATTGTVTTPAAPTALMATGDGANTFNLEWTAPASDKCSAITGYEIEQSTDGSNWTSVSADTGDDATTFAHTSQTLSDARSYRVRAKNSAGDGAWSTVFNTGTATAPGAPTSVTVTRRGSSALQVRWSAPASNGGSAVTGYRVQRSADGSDPWTDIYTGTDLRYNDNNLGRGITRHYRVYAKNTVGEGPRPQVPWAPPDRRPCPQSRSEIMPPQRWDARSYNYYETRLTVMGVRPSRATGWTYPIIILIIQRWPPRPRPPIFTAASRLRRARSTGFMPPTRQGRVRPGRSSPTPPWMPVRPRCPAIRPP